MVATMMYIYSHSDFPPEFPFGEFATAGNPHVLKAQHCDSKASQ